MRFSVKGGALARLYRRCEGFMWTSRARSLQFLRWFLASAVLGLLPTCNGDKSPSGDAKATTGGVSAFVTTTQVASTTTVSRGDGTTSGGTASGGTGNVLSATGASNSGSATAETTSTGKLTSSLGGTNVGTSAGGNTASSSGGASSSYPAVGGTTLSSRTSAAVASDITLPQPRLSEDAHPVLKALSARRSTREFSAAELSSVQQSELLWAAFGVNRSDNRRTAPSAWNCQDIELYALTSAGVFKYNAIDHSAALVASQDARSLLGSPYDSAPLSIVYVSSQGKIPSDDKVRYSYIHTGLVGMNVYLYAAYESMPVVIRSDIPNANTLALSLDLASEDQIVTLVQTIGLASGQSNPSGAPFKAGSLVTPRYTTHPILKALKNRKSSSGFAPGALAMQTLAEVLWSGFGVNRSDGKRTAPSAHNCQDIDIYAAMATGVYRYDAAKHVLRAVSGSDVRPLIGGSYANAPLTLVYVSDFGKISSAADQARYSAAHSGFIAQNVNAYCASENLATRVYESINDKGALSTALQLKSNQQITLIQAVGEQP